MHGDEDAAQVRTFTGGPISQLPGMKKLSQNSVVGTAKHNRAPSARSNIPQCTFESLQAISGVWGWIVYKINIYVGKRQLGQTLRDKIKLKVINMDRSQ